MSARRTLHLNTNVPLLQRKGIFRRDYDGTTLREHYGLPRPVSRYADALAHAPGEAA